jgi:hypothetical protein
MIRINACPVITLVEYAQGCVEVSMGELPRYARRLEYLTSVPYSAVPVRVESGYPDPALAEFCPYDWAIFVDFLPKAFGKSSGSISAAKPPKIQCRTHSKFSVHRLHSRVKS